MAHITLNADKLRDNYLYLDDLFAENNIEWSVVTKMLCGNTKFLEALMGMGIKQVCDSRIVNLKRIKEVAPSVETIFIKPPSSRIAKKVVEYADISLNTSFATIKRLSQAAVELNKVHKIIIMVELGERREGVLKSNLISFFSKVFELPNIEVIGIGTNLTCMYGVLPDKEKLQQLGAYQKQIEEMFGRTLPYISGGASVTIPLIERGELPACVNHFRVGETLFLGTDVYSTGPLDGMHQDVFKVYAEIIELYEKPNAPSGEMGYNLAGEAVEFDHTGIPERSFRAIVDIGLLDVESNHLQPVDENIKIAGASSDMLVLDLDRNIQGLKVGSMVEFRADYMGVLRLMNSKYIDKKIEISVPEEAELLTASVVLN
ncbi:MAG: amino-acid racemase [Bacteroidetes bacterium 46-16]|nr:MAG: amino-acid racemase [Bacteroidetes bacterium 46-16]